MTPARAHEIAFVAHTAIGQTRANGITPYITHPTRVAELAARFSVTSPKHVMENRCVAAYLHDVLEDTKLDARHLLFLGVTEQQLDIIERLTKPGPGPAPESYYRRIAESKDALVVKCADRCANLEDALAELIVLEPREPRRWGRYVEKTYKDVLPMYAELPDLRWQIEGRLKAIEKALPASLERHAAVVERERLELIDKIRAQGLGLSVRFD